MASIISEPIAPPLRPRLLPEHPPARAAAEGPVLCTAETAECTCPDFCERDHGNE
jgi:hypothetical protein